MTATSTPHGVGIGSIECAALCAPLVVTLAFGIASGNAHWIFWAGLWPSLLVYLGLQVTPFTRRLFVATWIAVTIGALIPLIAGIVAYYSEWGVPTGLELLTSRYDTERMNGYMRATFGNTGNTAAYLALLIPPWFAFLIARNASGGPRVLYVVALTVALAHVLIVESRTLFIVLITVLPLVTYFYRVRFAFSIVGLIVASSLVLFPLLEAGDKALELTFGAFEGTSEDQSLTERLEAMQIGLGLMFDNPALGVGPGNSAKVHIYTSAHQYWINQGEEIGVLGLILSVALSVAVFWRFFSCIQARSIGTFRDRGFPGIAGAAGYMLYGCMANMALSSTVVNAWIGLFAIMLALDSVRFSDLQDHRQGVGVGRVEQ